MTDAWWEKFMTYHRCYIAWDETQSNELGRFLSYDTAKEAILEYAKTLDKKETKMDFQVGDKVVDVVKGAGQVVCIREDETFCVEVDFLNGDDEAYTKEGYCFETDKQPSLYYEGTEINIKPAEPKRYPWVNIYVDRYGNCFPGGPVPTKKRALDIVEPIWKYVDTIQLKPKGEEK